MSQNDNTEHISLSDHIDALFRLAQTLTSNYEQAASLVAATYERAFDELQSGQRPQEVRLWLLQLLRERHNEIYGGLEDSSAKDASSMLNYQRRSLTRFLERALPPSFAALPKDERTMLYLCKVEGYSCADAASILQIHADGASGLLEQAHANLKEHLYSVASPPERKLLNQTLTTREINRVLQDLVRIEFSDPPDSLTSKILRAQEDHHRALLPEQASSSPSKTPNEVQSQTEDATSSIFIEQEWFQRTITGVLLILLAAIGLYAAVTYLGQPSEEDLLTLSAQGPPIEETQFIAETPEEISRALRTEMNLRLFPPHIQETRLVGLSIDEPTQGIRVPVLHYLDQQTEETFPLYVYTYADLNRHSDQLTLNDDILRQIEDDRHIETRNLGRGQTAVVWRHRNIIFVGIPPSDDSNLAGRIEFD